MRWRRLGHDPSTRPSRTTICASSPTFEYGVSEPSTKTAMKLLHPCVPLCLTLLSRHARRPSVRTAVCLARWRRYTRCRFRPTTAPTTTCWRHLCTKARVRVVGVPYVAGLGNLRCAYSNTQVFAQLFRHLAKTFPGHAASSPPTERCTPL